MLDLCKIQHSFDELTNGVACLASVVLKTIAENRVAYLFYVTR